MAKRAKAGSKPKGGAGAPGNLLREEDLRPYLDEVHDLTDQMEEYSASKRQAIGKVYEKMTVKLGLTKDAVMFVFKQERRERRDAEKAAKMDAGDRSALERCARAFGGGFGDYLTSMAALAGQKKKGTKSDDEAGGDRPEAGADED